MKTNEFIGALRDTPPTNALVFANAEGEKIQAGYHLTELKAAAFETVDCGGQVNRWDETIAQLWVPSVPDEDYMSVAKFLKIFDRVSGMISLDPEAEMRIEYGDDRFFPSNYHVRSVTNEAGHTCVLLEPPQTTCKARDRRAAGTRSSADGRKNVVGERQLHVVKRDPSPQPASVASWGS